MSYIQDKLKEALGGNKVMDSKNTIIHDWTPNNIKVLVISRNFILIIYHVGGFGGSKVIKLDSEQVKADLEKMTNSNSKLNTILKRRSFSCLEELYVDSEFISYPPIIDLMGYVQELVNSVARLRYFGYGEFPLGSEDWLRTSYQRNKSNLDYSIATDTSRPFTLEYRGVGYEGWFKNYYLRPKYYKLDEDNGKLAMHFRKFEKDYRTHLLSKEGKRERDILEESLKQIACVNDAENVIFLRKFDILLSHLTKGSSDKVKDCVLKVCKKYIRVEGTFEGLTKKLAYSILSESSERDYLIKSYERFGVLDTNDSSYINKEKVSSYLKEGRGFINIEGILDNICLESSKVLIDKGYKDLVGMALIMNEKDIPKGSLRSNYIKRPSIDGSIEGYFNYLGELVGVVL